MSPNEPSLVRRRLLHALGAGGVTALAGCNALRQESDESSFSTDDWHSFGNSPRNTNRVGGAMPAVETVTHLTTAGWPSAPPVVTDGISYFASEQSVHAVTADGTEQWARRLDEETFGAPALDTDRDRLYVPTHAARADPQDTDRASVTVLSLDDGSQLARFPVGEDRIYGVSVVDGDIYVRCATACVRLAPDGTERWRQLLAPLVYDEHNLGDSTATQVPPAVTEQSVYVPEKDALVKLDRADGTEQWRVSVDTPYAASVVDRDGIVQTGWQEVVAVDHDGRVRWRRDLQSRSAAATADGDVYVAASDLHELDSDTGTTNWTARLPDEATAAPVVTDESVLVVAGDVRAFRRNIDGVVKPDRKRWVYSDSHVLSTCSPVVAAGCVFVVGLHGFLSLHS